MGKVDLHLHSSVSDGVLSPSEVVDKAAALGLSAISLTDHDNVDGTAAALAAAARHPDMTFVPGVEISTDIPDGEVHMLGYFIDHTSHVLLDTLQEMRDFRLIRAQKMIEKLADLGIEISWERVQEFAGDGTVGRPHIAQALMEKGHIETVQEAFTKYLSYDGPAYVHRIKMKPEESIELILAANGIPVLAHPLTNSSRSPEQLIARLVNAGLAGLEAHYKMYAPSDRKKLVKLAKRFGLITTGGSDYHGLDPTVDMMMGEAGVPPEVIENLLALAAKRPLKPRS